MLFGSVCNSKAPVRVIKPSSFSVTSNGSSRYVGVRETNVTSQSHPPWLHDLFSLRFFFFFCLLSLFFIIIISFFFVKRQDTFSCRLLPLGHEICLNHFKLKGNLSFDFSHTCRSLVVGFQVLFLSHFIVSIYWPI